jgi:hypothetical protein
MDTTLPFEKIFLRTLEDGDPEQFVGVWDESSPPTQQLGEAEWRIETQNIFTQSAALGGTLCGNSLVNMKMR